MRVLRVPASREGRSQAGFRASSICARGARATKLARHVAPAAAVVADTDDAPSTSAPSAPRPAGAAALAAASAAMLGSLPVPLSFEHRAGVRDAAGRVMLKNLPLPELEEWCASVGEPPKRAKQLYRWLYGNRKWIRNLDQADSDASAFSGAFKAKVASGASLAGGLQLQSVHTARDGTRKLVFALVGDWEGGDGPAGSARGTVETVLIPMTNRQGQNLRYTACLSTQVGCAMNCQFCYTGRMGLLGNLSTAQIVEQVVEARRFLAQEGDRTPLTNLVFMGMGEPLHNTEAVLAAADIVSHYLGLHISHNKITISTVGLVPEMRAVLARTRVQVALSLHATTDEVRDWIVPVNRRYDLATLTAALEEMFPKEEEAAIGSLSSSDEAAAAAVSHEAAAAAAGSSSSLGAAADVSSGPESERWLPPVEQLGSDAPSSSSSGSSSSEAGKGSSKEGRSLLVEYTMLHGINDTLDDAHRLADMLRRVNCKVNLIVFNPHKGTRFQPSTDEDISAFRSALIRSGMVCTIRDSRGDDEMAACGQLGNVGLSFRPSPILDAPERFRKFLLPPSPAVATKQAATSPAVA